ncbi:MAG: ATP-binding protein [Sulfurimonas sp.]|nr:ATP-binding protein [Sulfurimonas sp.]
MDIKIRAKMGCREHYVYIPLRNRYVPALLLVAIFAVFAYINVEQIINSIENDAEVINTSGRQRMLSQNLILLGLKYLNDTSQINKLNLEKNINLMRETHKHLVKEHNPPQLRTIYDDKKLSVKLYNFLNEFDVYIKQPYEKLITELSADAQVLLPLLSEAVKEYEKINHLKVSELEQRQLLILIITIVLLLLEAIFIFYPASKQIKKYTDELEKFNKNLEQKVKEEVEKNREKEKQMMHQSRLAQMGEMISMIAHQWRQPLGAIGSISSTIEIKAALDSLDKDNTIYYARKISNLTQHLSHTIDDFRNFFKQDKEKTYFTSEALLESIAVIIGSSLKSHNINLIQDLNCNCNFKTYTNELKQVVLNLVKNAEDALIDNKVENPYIKIYTFLDAQTYALEVSDNAGGIAEQNINKIFDPYFSTKTEKNGTGLGLYMSKTIIHDHCGGTLGVYNDQNGAVFKITIPLGNL